MTIAPLASNHEIDQAPLIGAKEREQSIEGVHSCALNYYCKGSSLGETRLRLRVGAYALSSMSSPTEQPSPPPHAGLCDSCEHQVRVPNTRGSVFSLCARSRHDQAYPRYPRLPVRSCPGYERRADD